MVSLVFVSTYIRTGFPVTSLSIRPVALSFFSITGCPVFRSTYRPLASALLQAYTPVNITVTRAGIITFMTFITHRFAIELQLAYQPSRQLASYLMLRGQPAY